MVKKKNKTPREFANELLPIINRYNTHDRGGKKMVANVRARIGELRPDWVLFDFLVCYEDEPDKFICRMCKQIIYVFKLFSDAEKFFTIIKDEIAPQFPNTHGKYGDTFKRKDAKKNNDSK